MPAIAQSYRSHNEVALAVTSPGTLYLRPSEALKLAKAIRAAALSVKRESFASSKAASAEVKGRVHGEPIKES